MNVFSCFHNNVNRFWGDDGWFEHAREKKCVVSNIAIMIAFCAAEFVAPMRFITLCHRVLGIWYDFKDHLGEVI